MLSATPTVEGLYRLFPDGSDRPETVPIPAEQVPPPYDRLLVHPHHMTVTVEEFYRTPVAVQVLAVRHHGDEYARKILLTAAGRVVQFGLVRIDLAVCPPAVRAAIVAGQTPLGRILIEHNMLRRIEPIEFLRVRLSPAMAGWFGVAPGTLTYGRLGVIHSGERIAVEVLEILAPVPQAAAAVNGVAADGRTGALQPGAPQPGESS